MAGENPTREDTWLLTFNVAGRPLGVWDTKEGGEVDSEETKYPPGGMAREISLGGRRTIGNITLSRYCDRVRDWPLIKWLCDQAGAGRVSIGQTPLNFAGAPGGAQLGYTGTLKTVTPPPVDSTGSDAAKIECECTIDGEVTLT
jgi:hypothetical protein